MNATFALRAAPLLLSTMVAVPVWAQSANSDSGPQAANAPPSATAPMAGTTSGAPSGTSHKAAPHSNKHAMARQPGETLQNLVERRIADLHSKLHIAPEQSQQWDQFAQAMRDNAKEMDELYKQRAERFSSMSAVDNMQSYAQIEQQRAQDVQKLVPPFQALYASLSDQQKKTADQMFRSYAEHAQARHQASAQ